MDVLQEYKNGKPSYAEVVKQNFGQSMRQANNANELPIELTNTTGTYLQDMNEDCLLEIFSAKSLRLMDLCSVAETCKQFEPITQRIIPKELNIQITDDGNFDIDSKNYWREDLTADDAVRIFKHFGSIITAISYSEKCYYASKWDKEWKIAGKANFLLNLVAKYCGKRLQLLNLKDFAIEGGMTLFADCDSLVELNVKRIKNFSVILENIFPKLERFSLIRPYEDQPVCISQHLSTFISRHPHLKKLYLSVKMDDSILQLIGNSCKDLEKLILRCTNVTSLQPLLALKSVKTLILSDWSFDDFNDLSVLTNLRKLHLSSCDLPADLNEFASLAQLTKVRLWGYGYGWPAVIEMIRRLINLEELFTVVHDLKDFNETIGGTELDDQTFCKIVDIVKGRPNMLTLKCCHHIKIFDENQNVRLIYVAEY